jgi:hypothetical protein
MAFTNLVESIRTKLPPKFETGECRARPKTAVLLAFLIRPVSRCVAVLPPAGKPAAVPTEYGRASTQIDGPKLHGKIDCRQGRESASEASLVAVQFACS